MFQLLAVYRRAFVDALMKKKVNTPISAPPPPPAPPSQ